MLSVAKKVVRPATHEILPVYDSTVEIRVIGYAAVDHCHTNSLTSPASHPGGACVNRAGCEVQHPLYVPVGRNMHDLGIVGQRRNRPCRNRVSASLHNLETAF